MPARYRIEADATAGEPSAAWLSLLAQSNTSSGMRLDRIFLRGERDALGRRIPSKFQVTSRRDLLAEALWEYGEDKLAERALELTEDELLQVQRLTV
ncbi:MAG: hypothetical protein ABWY12_03370, partial [Burkholderiales bacterium]